MYPPTGLVSLLIFAMIPSYTGIVTGDCLHEINSVSKHLATKTAYRFVSNTDNAPFKYDSCEPKRIWAVMRHGTRNPGKKTITNMHLKLTQLRDSLISNHKQNRGGLCEKSLQYFTSWAPQVDKGDDKRLVHEGEDEMIELAERFQNRFPEILPCNYSNKTYKFRFTDTQRTMESKWYFTVGLFGRKEANYVWTPEPLKKDPILRFYKLCAKWLNEVKKNHDAVIERVKFEESDLMRMVISNVSHRMGFATNLQFGDIKLMYTACAFETSWTHRRPSPWCGLFTERELEMLEYVEDLDHYWIDGYGYDINHEQACPMMQDLLHHLTSEDEPAATFYFTHSGTLLKILSHLGLYKDEKKLTHDTFSMERLWRVGLIDSFATNLAFVLYECDDGPKLLTLHQERPVKLRGCSEELCPLHSITETYHDSFYNCKFSQMCDTEGSR